MLEAIGVAFTYLSVPANIAYLFVGSIIGLIFGILPGLGGVVALALALPFSFGMESHGAMLFFSGVMGSVAFGGSVSAILLNTPGTSQNAATCFDGYPMARKGEGNKALGISATACGLGAIFGLVVLLVLLPLVRKVVLLFAPPEFFMLVLFGLVTVALAAKGSFLKGLAAGGVGILLSLIGFSPVFGILRFPDEVVGTLEINWLTPTKVRETLVLGERGMFRVDDLTQDLYYFENAQANEELWRDLRVIKGVSEGKMVRFSVQRQEPLKVELKAFLQALETGGDVPVSGEDGLAALKIALALIESGQKHQIIKL